MQRITAMMFRRNNMMMPITKAIMPTLIRIGLVIPIGIQTRFGIPAVFGLIPGYTLALADLGSGACRDTVFPVGSLVVGITIAIQIYIVNLVIITGTTLQKIGQWVRPIVVLWELPMHTLMRTVAINSTDGLLHLHIVT
jgi:hypothetical protein